MKVDDHGRAPIGSVRWAWAERRRPSASHTFFWSVWSLVWIVRAIREHQYWYIPLTFFLAAILCWMCLRHVGKPEKHPGMRSIEAFEHSQTNGTRTAPWRRRAQ
jgi:hypothetical protein